MVSAGCVQNVPEASSSLCFVPNPADRVSLTHGHLPRGHGAKGQQHVCDDPTNASAPQPGAAKRRGRWIAALLFKVDDSLDFNPGLSGAPGELCPGQIQMYRGTGCAAGWAGSVPPAGRSGQGAFPAPRGPGARQLPPNASPRLGNEIFVRRSSCSGRPVSSLLQMLPGNDVHGSLQCCLFFCFLRGGFRGRCAPEGCWFAGCWTEHSGPSFSSCSFPHSQLPKTVSLHSPWAVLCLGCHGVLFGVSQCCPNAFPLPVLAAGRCPPLGASRGCEGARTAAPTGHGRAESAEIRGCSRQRGVSPPLGLAGAVGTARLEAGLCPCCHFQPARRLLPARRWYFAARPRDTVSLLSAHAYPPPHPSRHSRETFI